jgi:hypothetical protein
MLRALRKGGIVVDGFITFLVIIGIVNAIIKWARKQTADSKKGQGAAPDKPWQRMIGDMAKTMEATMTGKQPASTAPAVPVFKTLKTPIYNGEGTNSGTEGLFSSGLDYQRPATIADSLNAQSTEGTSLPQEPLPQWHGSLSGTEGSVALTAGFKDMSLTDHAQEAYPTLNLRFNRDSLVQAVVMQEILARPQDRRRRWVPH